jgi:hypothetical protein
LKNGTAERLRVLEKTGARDLVENFSKIFAEKFGD